MSGMAGNDNVVWFTSSVSNVLEYLRDDLEESSGEELVKEGVDILLDELAESYVEAVGAEKERRHGFERRLYHRWGSAFDMMEFCIMLNHQTGRLFSRDYGDVEDKRNAMFAALVRLHARACQVAREVLALMRKGYADGAFSRWRAVYEMAATACFIAKNGEATARRFLEHRVVDDYFEILSRASGSTRIRADLGR